MSELTVKNKNLIHQLRQKMKTHFAGDASGHDWYHTERVYKLALKIAEQIKPTPDKLIISLATLAHDYTDWKFEKNESAGDGKLLALFNQLGVDLAVCRKVLRIIHEVSYKGAGVTTPASSIESAIVQDADRLDAIGAIGIARAFAYGGYKGSPIYDPTIKPEQHSSFAKYKKSRGSAINHFYEKLLLLKDRLQTEPAKKLAKSRHRYMEKFLDQFYQEWSQVK